MTSLSGPQKKKDIVTGVTMFQFVFYCPSYQELCHMLFESCKTIDLMWLNDAERIKH